MAQNGLRYNNFHTTALCSPTRAALKSGRNHHTVNMGFITEMATGFPGATGQIPNATAPLAEMLRLNGYSTAAFGKWHETAAWEASVSGPFDRWPTRQGFDKFYGFIGGETNQWAPYLYDGVTQVELPNDPNYHFMTDMTDKARAWIKYQKALTPDKPFFVYFAPGATHAPHHVPKEWIAKLEGQVRPGLGQAARGNAGAPDRAGRGSRRHQAGAQAAGDQGLGQALGRREAAVRAPGRGVRRLRRVHRPRDRPHAAGVRRSRRARQHAGLLHCRRQRHQRRRRPERHVQRIHLLQRRAGEGRGHAQADRQVGRPRDLPAHGGRLGGGASTRRSAG
ncbi:MAG: sulfatase-like hydrolase/transferase [Burkholderiaceae bacterium]|nr:sulfatase-like hydrolase/transferase [Burkholderiaceae bacterium]